MECIECTISKSLEEFSTDRRYKLGLKLCCKECEEKHRKTVGEKLNALRRERYRDNHSNILGKKKSYYEKNGNLIRNRHRAWRQNNTEKIKELRLQYKYKISLEEYNSLHETQQGLCAICQEPPSSRGLVVDHDHDTGVVRGLLCDSCNVGIGALKDDPKILRNAALYLEARKNGLKPS